MGPNKGRAVSGFLGAVNAFQSKEQLKNEYVRDASTVAGQAVFNAFKRKKNRTFEDLTLAKDLATEADAEERAIKSDQAAQNNASANALSQTAKMIYNMSRQNKSFLSTASKNEIEKEVVNQNKDEINRMIHSPAAGAMERLSIQDYFPTIQDDIAVGTYSGRRLGSATIFAAPGFVTPVGMLDARKRALAETVANKQKALDDLMSIPDAPEQFNQEYKLRANEAIQNIAAKHGYNVNAIMRDKEAMAEIYRWQTTAEAFVNVDEQIDALIANHIDKDGNINYHMSKGGLKFMQEFRSGKLEDMDDYLSGKKNISEKLLKVKTLADGTRMVDRNMPSILANPRELPLNLKTGVQIDQAALNEIEAARKEIKGGAGYDAYLTVVKKYYDVRVDEMVDSWMTEVGYEPDDEARGWVKEYATSRIPRESLEQAIDYQANDDYKYYELRQKRAWEKEDKMAFWEVTLKKFEDAAVNKAIEDAQSAIDKETDPDKKAKLLADTYNALEEQFGPGFKVEVDKFDKGKVYGVVTVDRETQTSTAAIDNRRAKIYVVERKWDSKTNKWVKGDGKFVFFDEFKQSAQIVDDGTGKKTIKYGKYFPQDAVTKVVKDGKPTDDWSGSGDKAYNEDMIATIESSNKGNMEASAYEHHVQAGWTKGGQRYTVRPNNISQYKNSPDQTLLVTTLANPVIETTNDAGEVMRKQSRVRVRWESDLENDRDRQTLEVISGSKQQNVSRFGANE